MTQQREEMSRNAAMHLAGLPDAQGLYDPRNEHDACGIGFVANIHNRKSHKMIEDGLRILENLEHRGAVGADPKAGDGAGILIQIPDAFFRKEASALGFALRRFAICWKRSSRKKARPSLAGATSPSITAISVIP